ACDAPCDFGFVILELNLLFIGQTSLLVLLAPIYALLGDSCSLDVGNGGQSGIRQVPLRSKRHYNVCQSMTIAKVFRSIATSAAVFGFLGLVIAAGAGGYHLIQRISIPGDTGWDYITADSAGRRLYVPHGVEVE